MGDMAEIHRALDARSKAAKRQNMATAEAFWAEHPGIPWQRPTPYHWQLVTLGGLINYWPSTNKWQFQGKIHATGPRRLLQTIEMLGYGDPDE